MIISEQYIFIIMVSFTSHEIRDLIISLLIISGLFAYIFSRGAPDILSIFIGFFPITLVAVGLGFVLHELAHKFVAMRYGYPAEYKMWLNTLVLAIILAIPTGVVLALPGAVVTYGDISKEENGKISVSGPLTGIALALIFLFLLQFKLDSYFYLLFFMGFFFNSYLALLNLIPVWMLDGKKVLEWNRGIWLATTSLAFVFTAYAFLAMYNIISL